MERERGKFIRTWTWRCDEREAERRGGPGIAREFLRRVDDGNTVEATMND